MVMGVVVCHGRSEVVARGDDLEPHVRERWDRAWCASDGDRRGPVQDHEGRRAPADGFRTVPGEERQGSEVHRAANVGGTPEGHSRLVPVAGRWGLRFSWRWVLACSSLPGYDATWFGWIKCYTSPVQLDFMCRFLYQLVVQYLYLLFIASACFVHEFCPSSCKGQWRGVCRVLVRKREGKGPLRKPRPRWEDNIKMYYQDVGWGHELGWSGSGQGQVGSSCECDNEPSGSIKCVELFDWLRMCFLL